VDETAETDKLIAPTRLGRTVEQVEAPQEFSDGDTIAFASGVSGLNLSIFGERYSMPRARWRGEPKLGIFALRGRDPSRRKGFYGITSVHLTSLFGNGRGGYRPRRQNTRSSPRDEEEVKTTQGCGKMSS